MHPRATYWERDSVRGPHHTRQKHDSVSLLCSETCDSVHDIFTHDDHMCCCWRMSMRTTVCPHISGPDEQQRPIHLMSPRLVPAENSTRPPPSGERGRASEAHHVGLCHLERLLVGLCGEARPLDPQRDDVLCVSSANTRVTAPGPGRAYTHPYRAVRSSRAQRMQRRLSASPLECWLEHGGCGASTR